MTQPLPGSGSQSSGSSTKIDRWPVTKKVYLICVETDPDEIELTMEEYAALHEEMEDPKREDALLEYNAERWYNELPYIVNPRERRIKIV